MSGWATVKENLVNAANKGATLAGNLLFAKYREEIVEAVEQAQTERARGLLLAFCAEYPATAGVVTALMKGTPDQAINNIELFDAELAATLREHYETFKQIQSLMREANGAKTSSKLS